MIKGLLKLYLDTMVSACETGPPDRVGPLAPALIGDIPTGASRYSDWAALASLSGTALTYSSLNS